MLAAAVGYEQPATGPAAAMAAAIAGDRVPDQTRRLWNKTCGREVNASKDAEPGLKFQP